MKHHKSLLVGHLPVAAFAAVLALTTTASAQSLNWLGGNLTNGSWGAAGNFNGTFVSSNTTDLTFNNLTRATTNSVGGNRTVRSITFGAEIDSAWTTATSNATIVTFAASSGNASLNVLTGATGNITFGPVGADVTGSFSLASNLDINHNGSGLLTFQRQIGGAGGITKSGTGTVVFTGFNAPFYTGPLNVNGGRVVLNNTQNATADLNAAVNIDLGGGTLEARTDIAFGKTLSQNFTVSSASTFAYNNTTNTGRQMLFSASGNVFAVNADLTVQNISANTTVDSVVNISRNVTGTGDIIVETYNNINSGTPAANFGIGRVAFGGNNTGWSGDLVIRQGTVQVFGNSTLGQVNIGTGDLILGETGNASGAGFLTTSANSGGRTIANDIIVRSGGFRTIRGGSDNTYTFTGAVTLEGDLNIHNGLFFTDKSMIFTGDISGVGGLSITESGNPNFIRLAGNNTYSGATSIGTNATVNILGGSSIGDSSAVTLASGAALSFNASNETVGSIASSGTDGTINLGANTLTAGGDNTSTSFGGSINGVGGSLTKTGAGTMTLTNANTYTGTTTVSAGTLVLGSSASLASTAFAVESGATLDVSALSGGNLAIAAASRIGGDGAVTGNLNLASGALFVFTMGSTLDVSGTVSLDNTFSIASLVTATGGVIDWSTVVWDTYTLVGTTASTFDNIANFGLANAAPLGGPVEAYFQNGALGGLELVVIPEPSVWALLALSLTSVFVFRRYGRSGRRA